jgi:hypothetical protein
MSCYSVSDATTEALLPILSDNPFGVCLIRDELAAFFNGMDSYRNGSVDRQIYIEIHGGRFVQAHRKTGTRYLAAKTPSMSIIGGIQSDVIRRTVRSDPEFMMTGFGARFLMVYPPAKPIRWNRNFVNATVLASYEGLIETLLRYREQFTPDEPGIVSMTPEATSLIFGFQNQHADDSLDIADGNVRYVENKAGMHCARLALVLHVIGCIEYGLDPITPITAETMWQAIALTEWFLNEAHRIYAMFATSDEETAEEILTDDQREVVKVLRRVDRPATERELKRASRVLQKLENIGEVLRQLIAMKKVQDVFRNGVVAYDFPTVDTVAVDELPVNSGKYQQNVNVNTVNAPEYDFSDPPGAVDFSVAPNPESAPPESLRCPNCAHHCPETYPDGLCAEGYCQMDLPCHDLTTGTI